MSSPQFDAIVVGSGISGGWAAKELTEKGAKVLLIDRGRMVRHGEDYEFEHKAPWEMPFHGFGDRQLYDRDYAIQRRSRTFEEGSAQFYVNDREQPYQMDPGTDFSWLRANQVGGRSLTWGRASFRYSDFNFSENKRDGHGIDWHNRSAQAAVLFCFLC